MIVGEPLFLYAKDLMGNPYIYMSGTDHTTLYRYLKLMEEKGQICWIENEKGERIS